VRRRAAIAIRVQGDDVPDVYKLPEIAGDACKACSGIAAQQRIQVRKLAALTFVAIQMRSCEFQRRGDAAGKNVMSGSAIFFIQRFDLCLRLPQQRLVSGESFFGRVANIVSRAKYRLASRFARKRTSSASISSSMFCASFSIVGTTTACARARQSRWKNPCAAADAGAPTR